MLFFVFLDIMFFALFFSTLVFDTFYKSLYPDLFVRNTRREFKILKNLKKLFLSLLCANSLVLILFTLL